MNFIAANYPESLLGDRPKHSKSALEIIEKAVQNDEISNQDYQLVKGRVSDMMKDALSNVVQPLIKDSRDEAQKSDETWRAWITKYSDLTYLWPTPHNLASVKKKVAKAPASEAKDAAMAALEQMTPVADAVNHLKTKIVKKVRVSAEERKVQALIPKTAQSAEIKKIVQDHIEKMRPQMVKDFIKSKTSMFNWYQKRYGNDWYEMWSWNKKTGETDPDIKADRRNFSYELGAVTDMENFGEYTPGVSKTKMSITLNKAKLDKEANEYVDFVFAAVASKLMAKCGEMTHPVLHDLDSHTFQIDGQLKGQKVLLRQKVIINHSVKNKMFYQFPCLIWVDGKKNSEAEFKKKMID